MSGHAVVSRSDLVDAIKRARLVVEKNSAVRLTFSEGQMVMEAGQGDNAQISEAIEAELNGEEVTMAFNPSYLLEGLGVMTRDFARISFTHPTKPAVVTEQDELGGEDSQDFRLLQMPIRIYGN